MEQEFTPFGICASALIVSEEAPEGEDRRPDHLLPAVMQGLGRGFPLLGPVAFRGAKAMNDASRLSRAAEGEPRLRSLANGQPRRGAALELSVDGVAYALRYLPYPMPWDLQPRLHRPSRRFDPTSAIEAHDAHVVIRPKTKPADLAAARRDAAVVQALAAVLALRADLRAVLWGPSLGFQSPLNARTAASRAAHGEAPVEDWLKVVSLPVPPQLVGRPREGQAALRVQGLYSLGLAPFLGREFEIAPSPSNALLGTRRLRALAAMAIGAQSFEDRNTVAVETTNELLLARILQEGRVRRDPAVPSILFFPADTVLDPETADWRHSDPEKRSQLDRALRQRH
ncbi:MAG: hypothetical protein AAF074_26905 [Pseudomonadota bacterium]